jgi:hypothetical protein
MTAYRDQDDDDWDTEDDHGDDSDDGEPTVPCPYCRHEILEDSPYCPSCDRYLSADDHAASRKPVWIMATALICLGVAIWWVFAAS